MGEPLRVRQEEIRARGHAIECRIYAEDPENGFCPSPGRITRLLQPAGPGIREDCGVYEGWEVPLEYDPMLSKLVAFGETREAAIERMLRALGEYRIGGIKTNVELFRRILLDAEFRAGRIDTGYLERLLVAEGVARDEGVPDEVVAIAAALFAARERRGARPGTMVGAGQSRWGDAGRREGLRG
jgi:acetyl-CoA carboxylase biotin carboxylase subunit